MSSFFIRRPIVAMVISIVLVMVGLIVMKGLPIAQFPEIVPPMIKVSTTYVGASSVDVEQSVATPIEQQVNGVENMIYMKSINANDGTFTLQISFEVGSNLDMSNVLSQNRVSQAQASLPGPVKSYGVTTKKSLTFPLLLVSLTSPNGTYDSKFLSNYATININDRLARLKGVGEIVLFGSSEYAMRLWVKPDLLTKLGLTVPDIVQAIQEQNVIAPGGQVGAPPAPPGTQFTYTVRTRGRLLNEEEFANIVLRTNPDGSSVKIKDVGRVELGSLLYNQLGRNSGKPAAVIGIYQLPGSNAIEIAKNVKQTMKEAAASYPPDLVDAMSLDTTLAVEEGINEIVHTIFEAVLLVILVVFIFLQNWRATLIPLIAVPVSLIATFAVFPLFGFSVNTLSLLGMVLAIGIVVDDAIVVVEAVMHHIEHGMTPKEATEQAMKEVSGPVIAIALILSAVFVPVAFIGGITGLLFQQFALTIAISVLFSAFNALTLSPALAAMLLKPAGGKKSFLEPFYKWFNKVFGRFTDQYTSFTSILVRKMFRSLIFIGILCVAVFFLMKGVPSGFVPEEDNGYFMVNVQLPDASSLERTDKVCRKVEAILAQDETIDNYTTIAGYSIISQTVASSTGCFFVSMKPWGERGNRVRDVIAALNARLSREIPEALVYAFGPPAIQGLGTGAGFTFMLQDRSGHSPTELGTMTDRFMEAARKRPEIGRIATFYRPIAPQLFAEIDNDKVLKQGVKISDVTATLGTLYGANYVNDFNRFGRVYKVYVSAEAEYRDETWDLSQFSVRNNQGAMVPLNTLVALGPTSGPEYTNRFNLFRSAELTGVPAPGFTSGQALASLEAVAKEVLPAGWGYDWANMSYQEIKAAGTGGVVFLMALIFVFLILAAQYESWSLPFSILLGTPFVILGAFLGLFLARFSSDSYVNNVFTQIGLVTLIGLGAKNAILIVEFAKMKKEEGMDIVKAALEAAKLRLRPILMTSFAFILGVLPLVRASGAGAEARKVIGMCVFSGLLVATALAVCLIPVLYVMVERYFVGEKRSTSPPPKIDGHAAAPAGGGH